MIQSGGKGLSETIRILMRFGQSSTTKRVNSDAAAWDCCRVVENRVVLTHTAAHFKIAAIRPCAANHREFHMSVQINNILLPTDFSELAKPATEFARDLAERYAAQLYCLHVVDDAYQYWSAIGPESLPVGPPPEEMLEVGRTRLARFTGEYLNGLGKPVISQVAYGRPFAEIINFAKEKQVDLIVMGTHGRGGIAHVLLGSTTEKVVRKAPCAVLTVRTTDQPLVMP